MEMGAEDRTNFASIANSNEEWLYPALPGMPGFADSDHDGIYDGSPVLPGRSRDILKAARWTAGDIGILHALLWLSQISGIMEHSTIQVPLCSINEVAPG
jgi:hypothetical protein